MATAAALVFSRVFGFAVVLPGFRPFGETLTSDTVLIGTALGAYGLTMAVMQLPLGILSDRIGRRPVLVAGTVLFVAGSAWAAVADSIWTLIGARLLQGTGTLASVAMAAVGETVPAARRTSAMALVGIPAGAGFLVGLVVGPVVEPLVGMSGLFWLTAAVGLAAGLPVLFLRFHGGPTDLAPATLAGHATPVRAAHRRGRTGLRLPVASLAVAGFATNYALTTVVFFLPTHDALLLAPLLVAALVVLALTTRMIDRAGWTWQPVAVCMLLLSAAAAVFDLGGAAGGGRVGVWLVVAGGALFFALHSILSATLPAQVSRLAGRTGGRGHGIQNVVASAGTFAAGPVAGLLAGSPAAAFTLLTLVTLGAAAFVVVGLRNVAKRPDQATPKSPTFM